MWLSFTSVQAIRYISFTLPSLFRLTRIMRIVKKKKKAAPPLYYSVRSVAHRFFSNPSMQYPCTKKELHINLRIVDWTIPPSIASLGICKIIGHYPDPKSHSAGDRLSSTQFECSSVVVICPRYSNRSWGAAADRSLLTVPHRGANGAENADK